MRTHLITRGIGLDYGFVGSAPEVPWWQLFSQLSAFEQPTLLVHADANGWRVFASAIPTTRRDRVNTRIRITLVLEGTDLDHVDGVLALTRSWFELIDPAAPQRIGDLFDEEFPTSDAERLVTRPGQSNDPEIHDRVQRVLGTLAASMPQVGGETVEGSWAGDVLAVGAQSAFLRRVEALILGSAQGWAVQLNLAGVREVREHAERDALPIGALVDERVDGEVVELFPKEPSRSAVPTGKRVLVVVACLALAGMLAMALWFLAQRQSSPGPPPAVSPSPSPSASRGRRGRST